MHFEAKPRPDDEEDLFQRSWFRLFENISVEVWQAAVEEWIAGQKWMPKPVEMRELCFRVAAEKVGARDAELRLAFEGLTRAPLPAETAERRALLQEHLRKLREIKQLRGPEAAPEAPALPEGDDER